VVEIHPQGPIDHIGRHEGPQLLAEAPPHHGLIARNPAVAGITMLEEAPVANNSRRLPRALRRLSKGVSPPKNRS
jgi:hypothetical protein